MDITQPVKPPQGKRRRRRGGFFLRFIGFMFAAVMIVFIAAAGAAAFVLWKVSSELPDYEVLAKYEPPVMTRIHADNGALIAEFSRERRIYVPITNHHHIPYNVTRNGALDMSSQVTGGSWAALDPTRAAAVWSTSHSAV